MKADGIIKIRTIVVDTKKLEEENKLITLENKNIGKQRLAKQCRRTDLKDNYEKNAVYEVDNKKSVINHGFAH